ncbi:MAG: Cro/Cl family transcriptional regulator [Sphingomonas hengshuiensis]|nr:MAG: Cro/Cl family transcriptional regulator [Sphingomonas hengshuiensis]
MKENVKRPNPVDVEVGHRIRLQRKLKGVSQAALAEAVGITFQQIQKYEKGTNRVGASRLCAIAGVLGVSAAYFFGSASDRGADATPPADELAQFIATNEGTALNIAFAKIRSTAMKRKIIGLVTALAEAGSRGT